MVGYVDGRRETTSPSKTISGESNSATPEMVNLYCTTMNERTFIMPGYFTNVFQTKHTNSSQESAQVQS